MLLLSLFVIIYHGLWPVRQSCVVVPPVFNRPGVAGAVLQTPS